MRGDDQGGLDIAVVGSGISGLSAAWLLSSRHRVTLFEADNRLGGHSHTVDAAGTPVDTGFIVYNEVTYPNLTALFAHLDVPTYESEMTFSVSLDRGRLEYGANDLGSLLSQRRNIVRPRFWSMMKDLFRFYRQAPRDLPMLRDESLQDYLDRGRYSAAFREDHLYPMAAAIWSTPSTDIPLYPAAAFIRFWHNHGLFNLGARPIWRTVAGGSREYVKRLIEPFADRIVRGSPVRKVRRLAGRVEIETDHETRQFDHVVIAAHADQALGMLTDSDAAERDLLGAFAYRRNIAVLHSDAALMPSRKRAWSSWNYAAEGPVATKLSVTYWMNRLQNLPNDRQLFVTLNPLQQPDPASVIRTDLYDHPIFDSGAIAAQQSLWSLQGNRNTWFCGAYFGAGFHEDGLQAGLAVAEQLGGVARPWTVADPSGRIVVTAAAPTPALEAA